MTQSQPQSSSPTTIPDYLLIGHFTADLWPNDRTLGGTVGYAARTANAFGIQVAALTSAAANEPLLDQMRDYADVLSLPADATTTFENIYEPSGRKQYVRGVASQINPADIPAAWLKAPLVHLAPIAGEADTKIAHQFKDAMVMLTLQGWLRHIGEDGLVSFKRWLDVDTLRAIDIMVYSEEDIVQAPELEQAFIDNVEHLFITRAERGGTYYHNGEAFEYSTPQVELVQPTGAGDVFAAALLASLPQLDYNMLAVVRVAARLGATAVTRDGLEGAPTPQEVQQALAEARMYV